jgi:UDP-N-acetylglucosamine--N-acetylmuramyl-(pentapeptide) pyrophosphoryl-undecaprenol N-acetylglucosamine transferase
VRIVITGGHHSSALPVIEELQSKYPESEIYWIGHKYSMKGDKNVTLEYREIKALNIPFYNLKAGKVYRTFNLKRLAKVPFGFFQALYYLSKIKPEIILSFGGYLAVPVVIAGWVLRVPVVTHEQTVVVGYANKVISRFADKILIGWQESAKFFPSNKTLFTGVPLRKDIFQVNSNNFKINPELPTIYITAGKTGSILINSVILESLEELLGLVNVIHQCGDHSQFNSFDEVARHYDGIKDKVRGKLFLRKFVFSNEIGEAFAVSDFVVSRSGAHTTLELLSKEKPCILIPIPWVSHNEQYENAKVLERAGLAHIIEEKNLTSQNLLSEIKNMVENLDKFKIQDRKILNVVQPDSAGRIVKVLFDVAAKKKSN